jgi:hypothetical protein
MLQVAQVLPLRKTRLLRLTSDTVVHAHPAAAL